MISGWATLSDFHEGVKREECRELSFRLQALTCYSFEPGIQKISRPHLFDRVLNLKAFLPSPLIRPSATKLLPTPSLGVTTAIFFTVFFYYAQS